MKKTITADEFVRAFDDYNRSENFTKPARYALYEYLTNYEEENETQIELDVIGLCTEYTEYESEIEAAEQYFTYASAPEGSLEENEKLAHDYLDEHTYVIPVGTDGRVIIANF